MLLFYLSLYLYLCFSHYIPLHKYEICQLFETYRIHNHTLLSALRVNAFQNCVKCQIYHFKQIDAKLDSKNSGWIRMKQQNKNKVRWIKGGVAVAVAIPSTSSTLSTDNGAILIWWRYLDKHIFRQTFPSQLGTVHTIIHCEAKWIW